MLVFLSTLNRESSALSLSLLALLFAKKYGITKKLLWSISFPTMTFVLTYLLTRLLIIDPEHQKLYFRDAGHLLYSINVAGIIFWVIFFYFALAICRSEENRRMVIWYHVLSLPYILTCFISGVLWEIRLYIPLFIGSLLLGKLSLMGFTKTLTGLFTGGAKEPSRQPELAE